MKINKKTENILRWIALPFSIIGFQIIAPFFISLLTVIVLKTWLVPPDSFYYKKMIQLMVNTYIGFLTMLIIPLIAPSHKKIIVNIIYVGFLFLHIFSIFLFSDTWLNILLSIIGMTYGLYYVHTHTKEIDFKIKNKKYI